MIELRTDQPLELRYEHHVVALITTWTLRDGCIFVEPLSEALIPGMVLEVAVADRVWSGLVLVDDDDRLHIQLEE